MQKIRLKNKKTIATFIKSSVQLSKVFEASTSSKHYRYFGCNGPFKIFQRNKNVVLGLLEKLNIDIGEVEQYVNIVEDECGLFVCRSPNPYQNSNPTNSRAIVVVFVEQTYTKIDQNQYPLYCQSHL
jgi:hypothetical protein